MRQQKNKLPNELKSLVKEFTNLLGEVIHEEAGPATFEVVESIRQDMVKYRTVSKTLKRELLERLYHKLDCSPKKQRHAVAQAFTLMLELINACEAAYRSFRLKNGKIQEDLERQSNHLVYVLTAHPTEARTPENIDLFHRIQNIGIRLLLNQEEKKYLLSIVKHNLKLAWKIPITRHEKPQVVDEANHLYSIIFRPDIFDTILRFDRDLGNIRIRTWVGGDKDGHPGVDEKVMMQCLQASRYQFLKKVLELFDLLERDASYLNNTKIIEKIESVKQLLRETRRVRKGDARKVMKFRASLERLANLYTKSVGATNPRINKIIAVLNLFPGLVIPLELREDSEIIGQALSSKRPLAISKMIRTLCEIADGGCIQHYAMGIIISMCESFDDIRNTLTLVENNLNPQQKLTIPIVPLFETASALESSKLIVEEAFQDKRFYNYLTQNWNRNFEIMLGYSDSSKGMGVLGSRLGIAKTIRTLDSILKRKKINPIFFHGSGGSVDRGGGSLHDQTAWWPRSALEFYKATIQGEMVERLFSSPEILISSAHKVISNLNSVKAKKGQIAVSPVVEKFADSVTKHYQSKISEPNFVRMVEQATPYSYLNVLKLGSRPTKRAKAAQLDFSSIRAIPWVLCWTQTRTLFPTWWGVGQTWRTIKKDQASINELKKAFRESSIFSSYIRVLGYTLSKVDLEVFRLYLSRSKIPAEEQEKIFKDFQVEIRESSDLVRTLTGEKSLIWFRPWLEESIQFRSSMIHPLNALQIIGHHSKDEILVRLATAGISSGMLTTG